MNEPDSVKHPLDRIEWAGLADEITLLAGQINAGNYQLLRQIVTGVRGCLELLRGLSSQRLAPHTRGNGFTIMLMSVFCQVQHQPG